MQHSEPEQQLSTSLDAILDAWGRDDQPESPLALYSGQLIDVDAFTWSAETDSTRVPTGAAAAGTAVTVTPNPAPQQQSEDFAPCAIPTETPATVVQPPSAFDLQQQQQQAEQQGVSAAAVAGPQQQHQQEQQRLMQIAVLLSAAADEALKRQFTNSVGDSFVLSRDSVYLYQGLQYTDVSTQMPCCLNQVVSWPVQNEDGSINDSFQCHSCVSFHRHQTNSRQLTKDQQTKQYQLQTGQTVDVKLAYNPDSPSNWQNEEAVGNGLWIVEVHGSCDITVTHSQSSNTAAAAAAAAPAGAAAAGASSSKKRRKNTAPFLTVTVEFKRLVVLRDNQQQQTALQRLQLPDAGIYWREWHRGLEKGTRWLSCVGLNTFTGKIDSTKPPGAPLPLLISISRAPPGRAVARQQQQQPQQPQQQQLPPCLQLLPAQQPPLQLPQQQSVQLPQQPSMQWPLQPSLQVPQQPAQQLPLQLPHQQPPLQLQHQQPLPAQLQLLQLPLQPSLQLPQQPAQQPPLQLSHWQLLQLPHHPPLQLPQQPSMQLPQLPSMQLQHQQPLPAQQELLQLPQQPLMLLQHRQPLPAQQQLLQLPHQQPLHSSQQQQQQQQQFHGPRLQYPPPPASHTHVQQQHSQLELCQQEHLALPNTAILAPDSLSGQVSAHALPLGFSPRFTDIQVSAPNDALVQAPALQLRQSTAPAGSASGNAITDLALEVAVNFGGTFAEQPLPQQPCGQVHDMHQGPVISQTSGSTSHVLPGWPVPYSAGGMLTRAAGTPPISGAPAAAVINESEYLITSDSDDSDGLDDLPGLATECLAPNAAQSVDSRSIADLANDSMQLQFQLLKVCAGMYGANSTAKLRHLLQQVDSHNWSAGHHNRQDLIVRPLGLNEFWFLRRGLLHLLVSKVRVWGPGADMRPDGELPAQQRQQILEMLLGHSAAASNSHDQSAALKQLLSSENINKATPWFTACHFCEPAALEMMTDMPELTWKRMLKGTKRGKLFYHIISTEASQDSTPEHRQQLERGMRLTLTALADRLEAYLSRKTPEQMHRLKNDVRGKQEKMRQQRQQKHRQESAVHTMPMQSSTNDLAATLSTSQAGHNSRHNSSRRWSDNVLWMLQNYCLFHAHWKKSKSPEYNGQLLEQVVLELFGRDFRLRGPSD